MNATNSHQRQLSVVAVQGLVGKQRSDLVRFQDDELLTWHHGYFDTLENETLATVAVLTGFVRDLSWFGLLRKG